MRFFLIFTPRNRLHEQRDINIIRIIEQAFGWFHYVEWLKKRISRCTKSKLYFFIWLYTHWYIQVSHAGRCIKSGIFKFVVWDFLFNIIAGAEMQRKENNVHYCIFITTLNIYWFKIALVAFAKLITFSAWNTSQYIQKWIRFTRVPCVEDSVDFVQDLMGNFITLYSRIIFFNVCKVNVEENRTFRVLLL